MNEKHILLSSYRDGDKLYSTKSSLINIIVATTPPLGWNSWIVRTTVTEQQIKNRRMQWQTLLLSGYNILQSISMVRPESKHIFTIPRLFLPWWIRSFNSRIKKFPSAANGRVLSHLQIMSFKGLKFGIHIMRGIPRRLLKRILPYSAQNKSSRLALTAPVAFGTRHVRVDLPTWRAGLLQFNSSNVCRWGVDFISATIFHAHTRIQKQRLKLSQSSDKTGRPII